MKIKCHWCGEPLSNGFRYSLECLSDECCKLSFNREGLVSSFEVEFVTDRKEYRMRGTKYGIDLLVKGKRGYYYPVYNLSDKQMPGVILEITDGMPQVEKLFNKLKTYVIFS